MSTVKDLKEWLNITYKDNDVIAWDIWDIDDVHETYSGLALYDSDPLVKKELSPDQAEQVLKEAQKNKDSLIGINWETIRDNIESVLEES